MPKRIQRRRMKGWTLPAGAICVDRSTPWGNPFVVGRDGTAEHCVYLHRQLLGGLVCLTSKARPAEQMQHLRFVIAHLAELRGKDLACWCKPGDFCHADVLLEIANAE